MAKSAVKSVFSLDPLPAISSPKPPFFARFGRFGGKNLLFRGVFLFSSRDFLARNRILRRKNQFDEEIFCSNHPNFDFCRRRKEERSHILPLKQTNRDENGHISLKKESAKGKTREKTTKRGLRKRQRNLQRRKTKGRCPKYRSVKSKWERWCWNRTARIEKQKAITEKTKHKQARQIVFLSLPHSTRKIQADFLSKRPHFSRLPPLFLSKPPYPTQNPFHPTRRTRAYAYIRTCALSEFAIFVFTLHLIAQQTVDQSLECEGKPCLHLNLHRNNLKFNTLRHTDCKKQVKAKGWSLHT